MKNNNTIEKRILPHSVESEQSVLGCVLIDEKAPMDILTELKENDFYLEAHKIIFHAMYQVYSASRPVDLVTLVDELDNENMLESVGGYDYIATLTNVVPSASNYKSYIDIVKRDSILRQLISASNDIIENAYNGKDKENAIQFAEKAIYEISQEEDRSSLSSLQPTFNEVLEKFETIQKDRNSLRGISTGLYGLDNITNGLQNSDLILIAARPGCGKTSLAMNIVNYAAVKGKKKVAIFSLEMPKIQLAQRSICSLAYVDMGKALKGDLSTQEWQALLAAKEQFDKAMIFVDDSSLNTPVDILSKCRRLKSEHGLDIIMIDYLQLMSNGKSTDNRQQEISEITRNLKIAARELNVPIILLSQLSRAVEARKDHRPMLADLRESGAIEQDADIVMFIYRPDMYNDAPENEKGNDIAEIIIAKHRNGSLGTVKVKWIPSITTFVNLEKDANMQSLVESVPGEQSKPKNQSVEHSEDSMPDIIPVDDGNIDDIF